MDLMYSSKAFYWQAAGGIVSTARDLEKFMAALASGKLGRSGYVPKVPKRNRKDQSKSETSNGTLKRTYPLVN